MTNLNQLEKRLSNYSLKKDETVSLKGGGSAGNDPAQGGGHPPPTFMTAQFSFTFQINP